MKNLIFIVEGETEDEFIKRILKPYLVSKGLIDYKIKSIIITMSGGGHGYNNIEHFKNTIKPVLHKPDEPFITSFIDHYGINNERKLPGYDECIREADTEKRLKKMEEKLNAAVQTIRPYRFFIPYIQRHEFETLLFSNPINGFDLEEDTIKNSVIALSTSFNSVEDINCTPNGAPSKRLGEIYSNSNRKYVKGADAVDIAELTTIDSILNQCPRFKKWVDQLIDVVSKS